MPRFMNWHNAPDSYSRRSVNTKKGAKSHLYDSPDLDAERAERLRSHLISWKIHPDLDICVGKEP
jgi:hypothetical protein